MENKSPDTQQTKSKREKVEKAEKMPAAGRIPSCLESCSDKDNCLSLNDILRSFNAPLSEEQAWSLIYQSVLLYRNFIRVEFIDKHTGQKSSHRIKVPKATKNLNVHKDGSVHISDSGELHSIARGGVDTDNKKNWKSIFLCVVAVKLASHSPSRPDSHLPRRASDSIDAKRSHSIFGTRPDLLRCAFERNVQPHASPSKAPRWAWSILRLSR